MQRGRTSWATTRAKIPATWFLRLAPGRNPRRERAHVSNQSRQSERLPVLTQERAGSRCTSGARLACNTTTWMTRTTRTPSGGRTGAGLLNDSIAGGLKRGEAHWKGIHRAYHGSGGLTTSDELFLPGE